MNLIDCVDSVSPGYEIEIRDRNADWKQYLRKRCKEKIQRIERNYPTDRNLEIDWCDVLAFGNIGTELSDEVISDPDKAIRDITSALISIVDLKKPGIDPINIRIINLIRKTPIRDIRSKHLGKFLTIEGIVRKVTEVRPRITQAIYRCQAGHTTRVSCGYGPISEPVSCSTPGCNYKKFDLILRQCLTVDSQKIRIQESPEGLRGGEQPQTLDIDITDNLCGIVTPGDRVVINGIIRGIQRQNSGFKASTIDIYQECNSIEISEKEYSEVTYSDEDVVQIKTLASNPKVHTDIAHSIAPTISGNDLLKLAISLQLFGGVVKNQPDGSRIRGDIHILIFGDPGIAKSQILKYVASISPRAIYTSGQSASKAGLTATAVRDEGFGDGRWTLEAGSLVLADMGQACVDEMDKMDRNDRSALHEAMEQQTISVSKAGITATLKSRCALLGAANPKNGRFDPGLDLAQQLEMGAALLSRFDIIILATDVPEPTRDRDIADHVLSSHIAGESIAQYEAGISKEQPDISSIKPVICPELMRKYIAYAKKNITPKLNSEAKSLLLNHYCKIRGLGGGNKPVPVTVRQLEAIVRMAEASAKMRLSNEVICFDAQLAIDISNACMKGVSYDPETGIWDVDKVESGKSKEKRDLENLIYKAIDRFSDENGRAKTETVVSVLVSPANDKLKIEKWIKEMLRVGDLMEPSSGIIKVI